MATASPTASSQADAQDEFVGLSADVLNALGSLKLTVALFACSMVIVLVGTLAQDEKNMFEVKQQYFTSWIAWTQVDDFFPQAFFPHERKITGKFPFPGGALIGMLLMLNLVAAKVTRFRVNANGGRLAGGLAFMALGTIVAALIITSGHSASGLQGTPPFSYPTLWRMVQTALGIGCAAAVVGAAKSSSNVARFAFFALAAATGGYLFHSLYHDYRIGDPGLRIVWQLTKGLGAGLILMVGCLMIFGKQGGNMLLHLGVGLLMVGQFAFGDRQLEQRLNLVEGQSSNALVNLDEVEMTFIQPAEDEDTVTAIPGSRLKKAFRDKTLISHQSLPVDVRVIDFMENSSMSAPTVKNRATKGVGLQAEAKSKPKSGGTDSQINVPAVYVELIDKETKDSLGVHLLSQWVSDQELLMPGESVTNDYDSVTINDTEYKVGLQFHREVKSYWVHLEDVQRTNYSGTETPRDYSSFIRIIDPETGDDRRERVWMNNPLRYRGETFFQSSYTALPSGKELTGLQVVRNSGWLIPYVACSITALGLLVHFLGTLSRFLRRREREISNEPAIEKDNSASTAFVAAALFAVMGIYMLVPWDDVKNKMRPEDRNLTFDFQSAGRIPVQFGGRVMPLDAYARQTLKAMSNKEAIPIKIGVDAYSEPDSETTQEKGDEEETTDTLALTGNRHHALPSDTFKRFGDKLENLDGLETIRSRVSGKKISALQWLMEVAIDERQLRNLPMFRIDADEVRSELKLNRRASKLYSLSEIAENFERVAELVNSAREKDVKETSFKEKKLMEMDQRTRNYTMAAAAFQLPIPPEIPAELFPPGTSKERMQMFAIQELEKKLRALESMRAPNLIPPSEEVARDAVDDPKWSAFGPAFFEMAKSQINGDDKTRPGVDAFGDMIEAYSKDDKLGFNKAVDEHLASVSAYAIPGFDKGKVSLERWMQSNWPTGKAMIMYIFTLVLGLLYFFSLKNRLRLSVWSMLLVAFVIHTVAIVCRIWITGRAPVINIYSSAVFIGWGAVLAGLIVEAIYKRGTGNILAAAAGTLTLWVAYGLNTGDTMPVLQAVLDTQFWLATHVISVSLGYVATLVAGLYGIGYLIAQWLAKDSKKLRELYRCCYGAACFGILFSFVGTVLGGLWADDSWGRFWGWDPKENGALLIVIWNALILHARWDGMVAARGFSILAIGGNIVTAWSWFGTNELGIGLHSYGFTSGVLMWLTIFVGIQLFFITAGILFKPNSSDPPPTATS